MYQQVYDPVGDSLGLSVIFAALPLLALFILLGGVKLAAHWAALSALAVALIVAIVVYSMPAGQAFDSGLEGAVFGLFPIMFIVWMAIWIYNMTVSTGHFAVLRRSFGRISDDQRVQAVIIAFCFGALLEALAGFGTPVAITAVMLIALGFEPIKAAAVALVANTAPVAFGAIAIPIITLSEITGLPKEDLGAMVGRQTPLLALFVPLILIGMVDGMRGVRQAWPAAVVGGFVFADGAVRLLELHLGRADRHRRLAALHRRDRRAAAGVEPERAAPRRALAARPRDRRRRRRGRARSRPRCGARTTTTRTPAARSSAPTRRT